jgi:hypothetical protein
MFAALCVGARPLTSDVLYPCGVLVLCFILVSHVMPRSCDSRLMQQCCQITDVTDLFCVRKYKPHHRFA